MIENRIERRANLGVVVSLDLEAHRENHSPNDSIKCDCHYIIASDLRRLSYRSFDKITQITGRTGKAGTRLDIPGL